MSHVFVKVKSSPEVSNECVVIPHVFLGQGTVPVICILVFHLNSVVAEMDAFVQILQAELLGTETQVTFPAKAGCHYIVSFLATSVRKNIQNSLCRHLLIKPNCERTPVGYNEPLPNVKLCPVD